MPTNPKAPRTLTIRATLHGEAAGGQLPPVRAYLFDSRDRFVDSKPAGREAVTFPISGDQRYRVVVGPDLVVDKERPSDLADQLSAAKAVSQDYIPQLGNAVLEFPIYENIYSCWWQTCILVHGRVQKLLNPGGSPPVYAPICNGTVQIFQVDLGCTLDSLASFDVVSLRDRLVSTLRGISTIVPPIPPVEEAFGAPRLAANRRIKTGAVLGRSAAGSRTSATVQAAVSRVSAAASPKSALSLTEITTTLATLQGSALTKFIVAEKEIL
ncbi:MAG TPA: hypothetical protein VKT80_16245, partial [Chloroflexota bacterium]|nr:hypothetical protein [Chloroflexota bacterium]